MYTPTQARIMQILDDGEPHTMDQLKGCLWDDQAPRDAVVFHITKLRTLLRDKGRGILRETVNGVMYYRQVRFISPGE